MYYNITLVAKMLALRFKPIYFLCACLFFQEDVVVSSTVPTTGAIYPSTTECSDLVPNCAAYGASICHDYRPWALAHCRAFCGVCVNGITTTPLPCVDELDNCPEYGSYICTQVSLVDWTNKNCRLYCKFCSV